MKGMIKNTLQVIHIFFVATDKKVCRHSKASEGWEVFWILDVNLFVSFSRQWMELRRDNLHLFWRCCRLTFMSPNPLWDLQQLDSIEWKELNFHPLINREFICLLSCVLSPLYLLLNNCREWVRGKGKKAAAESFEMRQTREKVYNKADGGCENCMKVTAKSTFLVSPPLMLCSVELDEKRVKPPLLLCKRLCAFERKEKEIDTGIKTENFIILLCKKMPDYFFVVLNFLPLKKSERNYF